MKFLIKKLLKKFRIKNYSTPEWNKILKENKKEFLDLKKRAKGKKILIATSTGGLTSCSHIESLLAFALIYYGARVEILLCDKVLPACMMATSNFINEDQMAKEGVSKTCDACLDAGKFAFDGLNLKIHYYSDFIKKKEIHEINKFVKNINISEINSYTEDEISIGEHSLAGTLRYYAVGELHNQKNSHTISKKYLSAGIITKRVMFNFFKKFDDFEIVVANHAIYIPQGIINSVSRKFNIRTVSYVTGYKKNSFIFSHNDTYHYTLVYEPKSEWENIIWDNKKEEKLIDYLNSRKFGTNDWTYYFENPEFDIKKILKSKKINPDKPLILMATNIIWDANLIYKDNIFKNMLEWIFETIDYFYKRKDLQLLIRVHPGEINYDRISNQQVKDEILKKYINLPKNIFIIGPNEDYSTYPLANHCDTVLIYASKVGMEFPPFGINVIVAGESYVKNKGITTDPKTKKEYFELLDKLPYNQKLSSEKIYQAKKYAYHFFFRRTMIIKSILETPKSWPIFKIKETLYRDIKNNKDKALSSIAKSIINDKPFIYDEEDFSKKN
jgi:hypothetical protein